MSFVAERKPVPLRMGSAVRKQCALCGETGRPVALIDWRCQRGAACESWKRSQQSYSGDLMEAAATAFDKLATDGAAGDYEAWKRGQHWHARFLCADCRQVELFTPAQSSS